MLNKMIVQVFYYCNTTTTTTTTPNDYNKVVKDGRTDERGRTTSSKYKWNIAATFDSFLYITRCCRFCLLAWLPASGLDD